MFNAAKLCFFLAMGMNLGKTIRRVAGEVTIHAHIYTCTQTQIHVAHIHTYIYIYTYTHIDMYICMYTYTYTHIYACCDSCTSIHYGGSVAPGGFGGAGVLAGCYPGAFFGSNLPFAWHPKLKNNVL